MQLNQTCSSPAQKAMEGKGGKSTKKKVTAVPVMQSRRGCCWECHTVFGHTSRVWPWGSLFAFSSAGLEGWVVSTHHSPATHRENTHAEVINSSQVPQEDMDWGHRPWKDRERMRQLVTSDGKWFRRLTLQLKRKRPEITGLSREQICPRDLMRTFIHRKILPRSSLI